jgi:hypothetical protein
MEHENMQKPELVTLPHHNSILTEHECELAERRKKLHEIFSKETPEVGALIEEYHHAFCLKKEERGETDLNELTINTGEAEPRKYPFVESLLQLERKLQGWYKKCRQQEAFNHLKAFGPA